MAKYNKRQKKKHDRARMERELSKAGYTRKELKNKSYKSIQSIAEHEHQKEEIRKQEQKKEEKREKQRAYRKNSRLKKKKALEKLGIDPFQFSLSQIDKIKLSDIKNNNFNRTTYPHFFKDENLDVWVPSGFDFEKKYKLKNGEVMYFAYRDFACEVDYEDLINFHKTLSNEGLLNRLWKIATLRPTFDKETQRATKGNSGTSSGSAGDFKYLCSSYAVYMEEYQDSYNANRRKATREHTGTHKGYQTLKNGSKNTYDTVSPRGLLVIANSIMYNVTEWDRVAFYKEFYKDIEKHIPEFWKLLPPPIENS